MNRTLLAAASSLLVPTLATPNALAMQTATAEATRSTASQQLHALFKKSDEDNLRRNPVSALFRGDMRYADQLGDYISDEYFAAEKAAAEAELAALAKIDRSQLSDTDKIAYDVFKFDKESELKGYQPDILALTVVRPINHFSGFHTFYPTFASSKGAAPFKTLEDYENNLKRHKEFVTIIDRSISRFREGMAAGVFDTKLTIQNVIDQLNLQLADKPEESPYYAPVLNFPESIYEADQARLKAAYRATVTDDIYPAYTRLRDFLKNEYLPKAREGVGLVHMKGGEKLYDYLIEDTTTLPLKAAEVHQIGLDEVIRIKKEKRSRRKWALRARFPNSSITFARMPNSRPSPATRYATAIMRSAKRSTPASPSNSRPFPKARWKSAPSSPSARRRRRAAPTSRARPTAHVPASSTIMPPHCRRARPTARRPSKSEERR